MENKDLKAKYDEMHKQGSSAWFSDGKEERELILKMGEPWEKKRVVEIGCGEGHLAAMICDKDAIVSGLDYSEIAIEKARAKYPSIPFFAGDYRTARAWFGNIERIVMQGVLEHLDDPFTELKWMMDNLLTEDGDVITSSPCFLNPRGIVWMTLHMMGAVMSKTDLHFLNLWDFMNFVHQWEYLLEWDVCDDHWGNEDKMIEDLKQRIPLALYDGGFLIPPEKIDKFIYWLWKGKRIYGSGHGATAVYHIRKK